MADSMRRPVALTRLIDTLDRLFPDEGLSRVVVGRSGMQDGMIAYSTRSVENWTNIVNEAIRHSALEDLVDAAAELQPNVPELHRHLQDYTTWAARQNVPAEGIAAAMDAQKAPGLFERARVVILAWFGIAAGCFALVGVLARESTHHLFDLPDSDFAHAFTSPGESAAAGLRFVGQTLIVAVTYFAYNPIGMLFVVLVAGVLLYFAVRRPRLIEQAYVPRVVVPIVVIGGFLKALLYDLPVAKFTGVLTRRGIEVSTFDPPAMFYWRAKKIWTGVVCSRIGNFDKASPICGTGNALDHTQNLYGTYLLDVVFTIAICTLGLAALRKLILPSHIPAWNLPRIWKRAMATAIAVVVLGALLLVPWTYGRTVASMSYPQFCTQVGCELHIEVDRKTYAFYVAEQEIGPAQPVPAGAQLSTRDILEVAFINQMDSPEYVPHDSARRWGGK